MEKKSWAYILEYFTTLAVQEEFCQIPVDSLITIINSNDLNTNSEEAVCEAVLRWIKADEAGRLQELSRLFRYIRFPLTRVEYIEKLNGTKLVQKSVEAQNILRSMHIFLTSPESDLHEHDLKHEAEKSRQFHHRHEEMMCVIGTRSRHPNPQTTEIKCFSYRRDAEYSLAALPSEPGACFAVCKHKEDVFASGGYHGETLFLKFLSCENRWQHCSPMLEGRWGHAMVSVGECIFIIGGNTKVSQTLSSIECYNIKLNRCELTGGLQLPVSFMPVAVVGHRIYIFGGKMHGGSLSRQIQCYDTKKGTCMLLGHIPPIASTASRVTVLNNVIYIFYRHGDIIQYKEGSEAIIVGSMPNFDHFGIVTFQGQILIVGSQSNQYKTVMFNPETKEMAPYHRTMKAALCNFYCMSIIISKQHIRPDNKHEVVIHG